jgi:Cu(I)/Ag(I) efflux system membrane fusion protein
MLVDVDIPVRLPAALTVPLDALVDSGERARVYIEKSEGVFEPREVETGWRDGETVEIRKGVQPGERVVVAATFLVDSESRLKSPNPIPLTASTAAKPFRESAHAASAGTVIDPSCGMPVDAAQATQSGNTFAYRGVTYYFCSAQCKQKFQHNSTNLARGHQGDD